jgi:hypothetical protein
MKKACMTLSILLWCGWGAGFALAGNWEVPAELWEQPRSGNAVLAQPVLRECVQGYLAQPASRILIHHHRSEESQLQAEELRAWLVALAVEAARIELVQDLKLNQSLSIELKSPLAVSSRAGQGELKK